MLLALSGDPDKIFQAKERQNIDSKALVPTVKELLGYREQVLALIDLLGKVIQRCVPDAQAQRLDAILSMDCPVWAQELRALQLQKAARLFPAAACCPTLPRPRPRARVLVSPARNPGP